MTLRDLNQISKKSLTLISLNGIPYEFVCILSPKKKKILYYNNLTDGNVGLSSDHTYNVEIVEPPEFDNYIVKEEETISRLFQWER